MLLNALFPTRDIGSDPAKIQDWAQAAEDLGYNCIEVADHVFGAAYERQSDCVDPLLHREQSVGRIFLGDRRCGDDTVR